MSRKNASCGRDLNYVPDLKEALDKAGNDGFDFISVPLFHPRNKREYFLQNFPRPGPASRSDKVIGSSDWSTLVVAKLSPWIQLDSPDENTRRQSEKAFHEEMSLAVYLGVPVVLVQLTSGDCVNLARCINQYLLQQIHNIFWIQVPMTPPRDELEGVETPPSGEDTWEWWTKLFTLTSHSKRVGLALDISSQLPALSLLNRWCGEPLKSVVMATDLFIPNKNGFPVLPKIHQVFMERVFKLDAQVLVTGASKVDHGIETYLQYINHLYQSRPGATPMERFSKGYEDYLQNPLQPLMDNLDSQTYEIFEKDPIKYIQYEKAVAKALTDRVPEEKIKDITTVVMVVGAGRGPLVDASLRAAASTERRVRVYAIEKNPGAVITLKNRCSDEWGDAVTVVSCDMREWSAPEKADILVSELLGSFGDNELSPECLDGAQSFLKSDGVSIPCSYTSYLAPLSSAKLYTEVTTCKEKDKAFPFAHYETPYVVLLQSVNVLTAPVPCFTFKHPNYDKPICNDRYHTMTFDLKEAAVIHGFSGYFDTVLYDDITLSIHPHTHSNGMISWFPIYFPIKDPMYVPAKSKVKVHMWRVCSNKKVWYEWCISEPSISALHNPNGRSYWIGL